MAAAIANQNFDNEGNEEAQVSSFQSLAAEGDILAKQGDFRKAIEAYSKALNQRPTDKNVLVARSRCFLALGENQAALDDAEASLKEEKDFFKGKFQKAEALYAKGDFEMALVYYHRGHILRPELDEFRLGIQKAREAIDNSIGNKINPRDYKPKAGSTEKTSSSGSDAIRPEKQRTSAQAGGQQPSPFAATKGSPQSERTVKQLLGELYEDKQFLEDLYHDRDFISNPNEAVRQLVFESLKYLEARTEFWRQQKPLYARKKDSVRPKAQLTDKHAKQAEEKRLQEERDQAAQAKEAAQLKKLSFRTTEEAQQWVDDRWTSIHRALETGNNEKVLRLCKTFIFDLGGEKVSNATPKTAELLQLIPNKDELFCNLYATMGKVYLQMKNNREAEQYTKKQLSLGRQSNLQEPQSSALATLGRIFVQQGRYQEAINSWKEKLPMVLARYISQESQNATDAALSTAIELTWLYHDIAKCYMAIYTSTDRSAETLAQAESEATQATEWAEKAVRVVAIPEVPLQRLVAEDPAASEAYRWSLFVLVLNAQVAEKKNKFDAKDRYQKALDLANQLEDTLAVQAIQGALQNVQ